MNSHYKRLSLGERNSIENFLNQNKSARYIAETLERSTSTISYEVRQNRLLSRGKYKGDACKRQINRLQHRQNLSEAAKMTICL